MTGRGLDPAGHPHSEALYVTERFWRVAYNTLQIESPRLTIRNLIRSQDDEGELSAEAGWKSEKCIAQED